MATKSPQVRGTIKSNLYNLAELAKDSNPLDQLIKQTTHTVNRSPIGMAAGMNSGIASIDAGLPTKRKSNFKTKVKIDHEPPALPASEDELNIPSVWKRRMAKKEAGFYLPTLDGGTETVDVKVEVESEIEKPKLSPKRTLKPKKQLVPKKSLYIESGYIGEQELVLENAYSEPEIDEEYYNVDDTLYGLLEKGKLKKAAKYVVKLVKVQERRIGELEKKIEKEEVSKLKEFKQFGKESSKQIRKAIIGEFGRFKSRRILRGKYKTNQEREFLESLFEEKRVGWEQKEEIYNSRLLTYSSEINSHKSEIESYSELRQDILDENIAV